MDIRFIAWYGYQLAPTYAVRTILVSTYPPDIDVNYKGVKNFIVTEATIRSLGFDYRQAPEFDAQYKGIKSTTVSVSESVNTTPVPNSPPTVTAKFVGIKNVKVDKQ